jgi:glycosyltransferase involved in cell wall biosynthesis
MQAQEGVEVEHVVVDGGSSDRTVEIARAHGCVLAPVGDDKGIFDAANKGTAMARGQLVGFLGSDDVLPPGALAAIARRYQLSGRRWVTGSYVWTDEHLRPVGRVAAPPEWLTPEMEAVLGWSYSLHMATYMEKALFEELGGFDLAFPVAADYKLMTEAMRRTPFAREPQVVALWRRHGENESIASPALAELERIARTYGPSNPLQRAALRAFVKTWVNLRNPVWAYRKRRPLPPVERSVADEVEVAPR